MTIALRGRAPTARRRGPAVVAGVLAVLTGLLAACGDSGGNADAQPFRARSAPSIRLESALTLTGAASITAAWTDDISDAASAPTCDEAVKGFTQDAVHYDIPRPPLTTSFTGHTIRILAQITGYKGPGAYLGPMIAGDDGTPALISIDGVRYGSGTGTTQTLTVNADDSGTWVFTRFGLAGAAGTGSLDGTLTWTCTTLRPPSATPVPTPPGATLPVITPSPSPSFGASPPAPTPPH